MNTKKVHGFLTVEAALVLPVFMITIFGVLMILKVIYIHERVQFALSEAANQMAAATYLLDKTGLLDLEQQVVEENTSQEVEESLREGILKPEYLIEGILNLEYLLEGSSQPEFLLKGIVKEGATEWAEKTLNHIIGCNLANAMVNQYISKEDYQKWGIQDNDSGMDYSHSQFLMGNEDILIIVNYTIKMPFYRFILGDFRMKQQVCVRAFTGNENFDSIYEVTQKEGDSEEKKEWVFVAINGSVYHQSRTCRYIDVKVKAKTYAEVKDHKRICEICQDQATLNELSIVYTTDQSNIFHVTLTCSEVKRTVSQIELTEALARGLGLCQLCKKEEQGLDVYLE